jgi:hypothetical protein
MKRAIFATFLIWSIDPVIHGQHLGYWLGYERKPFDPTIGCQAVPDWADRGCAFVRAFEGILHENP